MYPGKFQQIVVDLLEAGHDLLKLRMLMQDLWAEFLRRLDGYGYLQDCGLNLVADGFETLVLLADVVQTERQAVDQELLERLYGEFVFGHREAGQGDSSALNALQNLLNYEMLVLIYFLEAVFLHQPPEQILDLLLHIIALELGP